MESTSSGTDSRVDGGGGEYGGVYSDVCFAGVDGARDIVATFEVARTEEPWNWLVCSDWRDGGFGCTDAILLFVLFGGVSFGGDGAGYKTEKLARFGKIFRKFGCGRWVGIANLAAYFATYVFWLPRTRGTKQLG